MKVAKNNTNNWKYFLTLTICFCKNKSAAAFIRLRKISYNTALTGHPYVLSLSYSKPNTLLVEDQLSPFSVCAKLLISLKLVLSCLGYTRCLHPNLVSRPIKGILEKLIKYDPPVHSDGYFGMDGLCQIKFW